MKEIGKGVTGLIYIIYSLRLPQNKGRPFHCCLQKVSHWRLRITETGAPMSLMARLLVHMPSMAPIKPCTIGGSAVWRSELGNLISGIGCLLGLETATVPNTTDKRWAH
jgi:hypothetical protein